VTWVLDTNVILSGLLSAAGPPGRLMDMVLVRQLRLAVDDRISAEYREVIARPKFQIEEVRQQAFLALLPFQDHFSTGPWSYPQPPDPDDVMFLEVAGETAERLLVTGNLKHFPKRCRGPVVVLSPREAWEVARQ
jgi:putative PIN family toxin of toxin-antitoxin system